jgi:hypothetical protein
MDQEVAIEIAKTAAQELDVSVVDYFNLMDDSVQYVNKKAKEADRYFIVNTHNELPELYMHDAEPKKKKPCTSHEYTKRQGDEWKCRHCEHPLM